MKTRLTVALVVSASLIWGLFSIPDRVKALGESYIVVRIDEVAIDDDTDHGLSGIGEIQYICVGVTANRGEEPIVQQVTTFPIAEWYEADDDGVNRTFLSLPEQAVPCFAFPEDQMGEELVIDIVVQDDDTVDDTALDAHRIAADVSTAVTTALYGLEAGTLVDVVSHGVQDALERGAKADVIGHHSNTLRRADNFGMDENEGNSHTFDQPVGHMIIKYTVLRVTVPEEQSDWCVSVTLDRLRIMNDGDVGVKGDGEIYGRIRVSDRYTGQVLEGEVVRLPERDVSDVDDYPQRDIPNPIYFNGCQGLPPFLYIEVDVFDEDDGPDDVLGVLALMYTNRRMRENPGEWHPGEDDTTYYDVKGSPSSSDKARISLVISVWDPSAPIN